MTTKTDQTVKKPLGQRLLDAGLITEAHLTLALNEGKSKGIYLGEALISLGVLTEEIISRFLAEESSTALIDLKKFPVDMAAIKLVPYELARRHQVLPLSRKENVIKIAMADTLDILAVDAVELATGSSVDVVSAPKNEIVEAIEEYYAEQETVEQVIDSILAKGAEYLDEKSGNVLPIIRLVDQVVKKAIKNRATDIHFEPDEKVFRVRVRVDGVLHQELLIPKALQAAITARVKIMGNMDITETRIPLDGRISFKVGARVVDLRLSTLPTSNGEAMVLRVLDKERIGLDLKSLSFSELDEELFKDILKNPHGLILVTGPTGSGKTSTLYAALGIVNSMERNVLTLEDPIEYELPLVRQTPVRPEVGMDFPTGLRSMLRQDPDIIMVGEIRDSETATLAIRAALTGHLVLSTLHTNSASGAIPRLVDMGMKPYLVSSSLRAVVGQRLVRRICEFCKKEVEDPGAYIKSLSLAMPDLNVHKLYKGSGCETCSNTGYRGRLGIIEIMKVDDSYHDLIVNNAGEKEMGYHARSCGMRMMMEDGIDKAFQGLTTLEEVVRAVQI